MAEIGFGIIGLGRMGRLHAEHLQGAIQGARLVAGAVDPEHHARLLATNESPCRLVQDVAELVADPAVDAVVIASPSAVHEEHIAQAAAAGKAIFCEKPLADSIPGARAAVAAIQAAGVPFQIGFQRRYDPGYARARALIAEGAIGRPEMFRGLSADRIPPVDYLRTSGGLFRDLGVHDFDAARFLLGDEVVEVHAVGAVLVEPALAEFDDIDYGVATLRFQGGALGVIQNAWRAPAGYDIRAEVHGSTGKVITELDEIAPTRLYTPQGATVARHHEFVERFREAYRRELEAFVEAVRIGEAPAPGAEDGLRALLIADAATRSWRSGAWVAVEA